MNDEGAVLQTLATNRRAVLSRIAFLVLATVVLLYWISRRLPDSFPFLAGIFVVIMIYPLYRLLYLLFAGSALIVTDRGLIDRTSGLGFLSWSHIRGGTLRPYFGLKLLDLDLTDQNEILARLPLLRRLVWRYYLGQGGAFYINTSFVVGGAEALRQIISDRAPGAVIGRVV